MLVIGAGATGVQVASIFGAFGTRVQLFQTGPRILPGEDEDVSAAVAAAFRDSGVVVHENLSAIESFEKTPSGVRMFFSRGQDRESAEAALAVVAVGWVANTEEMNLSAAGIETDHRGFVRVDPYLRTSAPHIFAAGDITGRMLLVPPALQEGFVAATNAVRGAAVTIGETVNPTGSFTDPEYAQVGLTEARARASHDIVTAVVRFDSATRTIIDGRTAGILQAHRRSHEREGPGLPRRRRAGRRDRSTGGDRDRGRDACDRSRPRSAVVSDLRRDSRSRGRQRGPPDQPGGGLAINEAEGAPISNRVPKMEEEKV